MRSVFTPWIFSMSSDGSSFTLSRISTELTGLSWIVNILSNVKGIDFQKLSPFQGAGGGVDTVGEK